VFLGKVRGPELVQQFVVGVVWVVVFVALARWLYRRGLRRYSAFGG
jgi:ABC-2 type transport system permease protein